MIEKLNCHHCKSKFRTTKHKTAYVQLAEHINNKHSHLTFKCPRRSESIHRPTYNDHWTSNHSCSFCGGFNPDLFFSEPDMFMITGTDKNYKLYLSHPNYGSHLKFYYQHLTPPQEDTFLDLWDNKGLAIEHSYGIYTLPYFSCYTGNDVEPYQRHFSERTMPDNVKEYFQSKYGYNK